MWCSAFKYGRTEVDNQQHLGYTGMSTVNDHVCHANAVTKEDKHFKLTNSAKELDTFLSMHAALSMINWVTVTAELCCGTVAGHLL
jgi:hypothetical protein